jgi:hypothetical protein
MAGKDPRRIANIHISAAIQLLQAAQSKRLDHTDLTTVQEALDGLGVVQRSIAGAAAPDHARIAARLRQVATAIQSCVEPDASNAFADIENASRLFQAMAPSSEER